MLLPELIPQENIIALNAQVSKKKLFEIIAIFFSKHLQLNASEQYELFEQFIHREKLGSTYVSNHTCIPHIKSKHVKKTMALLLVNKISIPFNKYQSQSINICFAFITPLSANELDYDVVHQAKNLAIQHEIKDQLLQYKGTVNIHQKLQALWIQSM